MIQLAICIGGAEENCAELFAEGTTLASHSDNNELLAILNGGYGMYRGMALGEADVYRTHGIEASRLSDLTNNDELQVASRLFHQFGALFSGRLNECVAVGTEMIKRGANTPELGAGVILQDPLATVHIGLTWAFLLLGKLAAAEHSTVEAGRLSRRYKWSEGLALNEVSASQIAAWCGDQCAQLEHAQRAVEIIEQTGNLFAKVISYCNFGAAHINAGHSDCAIECLTIAERINAEAGAGRGWHGAIHGHLAAALIKLGQVDEAHRVALAAVEFCRPRILRHDLQPWFSLARAQILKGDTRAARATLEETQSLINTTEARYYQPFLHELRAEYAKAFATNWSPDAELREAHRLFSKLGMTGQVARLDSLDE